MSSRWQNFFHSTIATASYLPLCQIKPHQLKQVYRCKMHTNSVIYNNNINMNSANVDHILRGIFLNGVQAVRAKAIFNNNKCFSVTHNTINQNIVVKVKAAAVDADDIVSVNNGLSNEFCIDATKRCHLVGFGKAVYGLAIEMDRVLGDRLTSGILSVPFGTGQQFAAIASDNTDAAPFADRRNTLSSKIAVLEGAKHNLPDVTAEKNARRIKSFVECLNKNDVIFFLITGGGSALLPLCSDGITLPEKCSIIKQLAAHGANINDINTVRIDLSAIKGGKLAIAAANAHQVICLIVSDIINSPMHLIASGPTVAPPPIASAITEYETIAGHASAASISKSQNILGKYGLWPTLPSHIKETIVTNSQRPILQIPANVRNFIIANNQSAVNAAMTEANAHGLATVCISTKIDGLVNDLSEAYVEVAAAIIEHRAHRITAIEFHNRLYRHQSLLHFNDTFEAKLLYAMHTNYQSICLIGGGEPTVKITGNGRGGRNQELALRFSIKCHAYYANDILQDVVLLSAGTDGIDGPTTAAGAIGRVAVVSDYQSMRSNEGENGKRIDPIEEIASNNDSYNFYRLLNNGKYHVITGHTGTNVMDLHILYIPPLNSSWKHKL